MAKKNMRNEFEFMASVLDALGVEYKEADVKVRERWRGKVLDGWGVSYIPDDLKQFERWRRKCIEGLSKNSGGGGGETWKLFYEGTVTTVAGSSGNARAVIEGYYTEADSIRVTFDGVEYILDKKDYYSNPAYGDFNGEIIGFENYPFAIYFEEEDGTYPKQMTIITPEAGTHVLKIETPESGSGSDCPMKTATVTIQASTYRVSSVFFSGIENVLPLTNIDDVKTNPTNGLAFVDGDWKAYSENATNGSIQAGETVTLNVLLVKDMRVLISGGDGVESVSGEATVADGVAVVTGDCTIAIRGTLQ